MRNVFYFLAGMLAATASGAAAFADDAGTPIDLSAFSEMNSVLGTDRAAAASDLPIEDVGYFTPTSSRRFYLTGIVGASFATGVRDITAESADDPHDRVILNDNLFTAGGATGFAIDRDSGFLRIEVEGRYRGPISTTYMDQDVMTNVRGTDIWSTLANVWRDVMLTDQFGIYAGGGIGLGGANVTVTTDEVTHESLTTFAWQAGGGLTYAFTERVTLDFGYRFFAFADKKVSTVDPDVGQTRINSGFSAHEMLLSVRIYEPFRQWR